MLDRDVVRAAFREVHGARLHGFALLVAMGDRPLAGRLAAEALADGAERAEGLRHPERAAAWLRGSVVRALRRQRRFAARVDDDERRAALRGLGVGDAAYESLAALSTVGRAALIAWAVERFAAIDVETILGGDAASARRRIRDATRGYLAAVASGDPLLDPAAGPGGMLAERIRVAAGRAMGRGSA